MKTKFLYQPPLPFLGSKRNFVKVTIENLLSLEHKGIITKDTIFLDVFGGSGILSHNIKRLFPNNRVVWNDFDNFQERLDNIQATNDLLFKIDEARQKNKVGYRVSDESKKEILSIIQHELDTCAYVDFFTISRYLLFQNFYAKDINELKKYPFYAKSNYFKPFELNGYLENVERISADFVEVVELFKNQNVFSIYDPPYLFSNESMYSAQWSMRNFLKLMSLLKPPYFLYSHTKSGILDFMECFSGFENIKVVTRKSFLTKHCCYEEYMIIQEAPPAVCAKNAQSLFKRIGK